MRRHLSLISPQDALRQVHWPDPGESLQDLQASRTPAHIRLIFEELFFLELGLELKRREQKAQTGIAFSLDNRAREAIKKILPFHPTAAQKRVLKEIASDMEKPSPMRRLLQGDVGSGKTIVAFEAAIIAMENGYQVALMAPTEILAQQHYFSARRILENAGYRIVLLTGSVEEDRKREIRRHSARGAGSRQPPRSPPSGSRRSGRKAAPRVAAWHAGGGDDGGRGHQRPHGGRPLRAGAGQRAGHQGPARACSSARSR